MGLPLAVALSRHYSIIGFDVVSARINELRNGIDKTNEVAKEDIKKARLRLTTDSKEIKDADFIIVTVPTPIDKAKNPDLKYVKQVSRTIGQNLKKGAIIVYESTVYPGVIENICAPILEKESGMKCGAEFWLGYSPERINPGDEEHTITNTVKIVSGMDDYSLEKIAEVYSRITSVFKAKSIKTAEAAKVIENIQRDLNIALMNEL